MLLQLVIGILDCVPGRPTSVIWAQSSLMLIWNFFYDLSIGPVCFVIISKASATRVRSKSIALATASQGALGCVMTVAIPYMINPDQANMQGKLGFFLADWPGFVLFGRTCACQKPKEGHTRSWISCLKGRFPPRRLVVI